MNMLSGDQGRTAQRARLGRARFENGARNVYTIDASRCMHDPRPPHLRGGFGARDCANNRADTERAGGEELRSWRFRLSTNSDGRCDLS